MAKNFRRKALEIIKQMNEKSKKAEKEPDEAPVVSPAEPSVPDADYLGLIKTYKALHPKASAEECIRVINKAVPQAREQFLGKQIKAARGESATDSAKYSQDEIAGYMTELKKYQIVHKCGVYDAIKALDTLKPGLRQEHIKHVNS